MNKTKWGLIFRVFLLLLPTARGLGSSSKLFFLFVFLKMTVPGLRCAWGSITRGVSVPAPPRGVWQ